MCEGRRERVVFFLCCSQSVFCFFIPRGGAFFDLYKSEGRSCSWLNLIHFHETRNQNNSTCIAARVYTAENEKVLCLTVDSTREPSETGTTLGRSSLCLLFLHTRSFNLFLSVASARRIWPHSIPVVIPQVSLSCASAHLLTGTVDSHDKGYLSLGMSTFHVILHRK